MASSHVRLQLEYRAAGNKSVRRRFIVDHFHDCRTRQRLECPGTGGDRGVVWHAALAIKGNTAPVAAHDLLAAYLGGDAADRVSAGQVQRGSVSRIVAAILCADVRSFTNFAEETAPEEVTRRLNGIFDCVGDPVRAAGGEILKFLGDGVLAVFLPPDGANVAVVTPAALAAAREILARVEAL